jgi:hypothetical protein
MRVKYGKRILKVLIRHAGVNSSVGLRATWSSALSISYKQTEIARCVSVVSPNRYFVCLVGWLEHQLPCQISIISVFVKAAPLRHDHCTTSSTPRCSRPDAVLSSPWDVIEERAASPYRCSEVVGINLARWWPFLHFVCGYAAPPSWPHYDALVHLHHCVVS